MVTLTLLLTLNVGRRLVSVQALMDCFAFKINLLMESIIITRMHSSRMRMPAHLPYPGGCACRGRACLGGCMEGGLRARRHACPRTPPVDKHMPVKILPCPKLRLRVVTICGTCHILHSAIILYLLDSLSSNASVLLSNASVLLSNSFVSR